MCDWFGKSCLGISDVSGVVVFLFCFCLVFQKYFLVKCLLTVALAFGAVSSLASYF